MDDLRTLKRGLTLGLGVFAALAAYTVHDARAATCGAPSPQAVTSPAHAGEAVRPPADPPHAVVTPVTLPEATRPAVHPHPITPEHTQAYRDVDLLRAAERAIVGGRFAEARILLDVHHRELPTRSTVEEEGLWLLADCAERPSATSQARVRSFYDVHTDSSVRRRLRRSCLERTVAE